MDKILVLIFIDKLPKGKHNTRIEKFVNILNNILALDTMLQQIQLINNPLGRILLPILQHLHNTLKNRPKYNLGVSRQLRSNLLSMFIKQLGEKSDGLFRRGQQFEEVFSQGRDWVRCRVD